MTAEHEELAKRLEEPIPLHVNGYRSEADKALVDRLNGDKGEAASTIRQLSRDLEEARGELNETNERGLRWQSRFHAAEARVEALEAALREIASQPSARFAGIIRRALSPQTEEAK